MKSLLNTILPLIILLYTHHITNAQQQNFNENSGFACEIPTSGCVNGMFSTTKCKCECIPPYCHDLFGECKAPLDNCGGNPWSDCTRGENCPWWVNPLKGESCTTGPNIPLNLWDLYNTKVACCNFNFPYSNVCKSSMNDEFPSEPTKHPTIVAPEEDEYEIIPIKFDVMGLPDGISMRELKDEMTVVLKRILLRLADKIDGLRVSQIEEKVVMTRGRRDKRDLQQQTLHNNRAVRGMDMEYQQLDRATEEDEKEKHRELSQMVTLYFNVHVVRDEDGTKFGPLIIEEIRNSYNEVLDQIQTFADTKYFGGDINMNWCTTQNGKYQLCVQDVWGDNNPPGSLSIQGDDSASGELEGWAIGLIVIFVLIIVGCAGYWIGVIFFGLTNCFKYQDEPYHKDVYYDDSRSRASGYTSRYGQGRDRPLQLTNGEGRDRPPLQLTNGSQYSERRGRPLELTNGSQYSRRDYNQDQQQQMLALPYNNDDSYTINTFGTSRKSVQQQSRRIKPARDPTMYIPGQEDRPDPDADVLMLTNGGGKSNSISSSRRYYDEDESTVESMKPKREPTMYVDGNATIDEEASEEDPYSVVHSDIEKYRKEDGEDEYDDYKKSKYMTSETNAEYSRGRRDEPIF